MNPYAAAGWSNPQNPYSINDGPWPPNPRNPPTYGALPPQTKPESFQTFEFRLFHQNTLHCDVIGPNVVGLNDPKFFEVRTAGGRTVISRSNGRFARINWTPQPTLEFVAESVLASYTTSSFLCLSSDSMYRIMQYEGKTYAWLQHQSGDYLMYAHGSNPPTKLAHICRSPDGNKVLLKLHSEAFQAGLIGPCTMATILLFSGLNID